MAGYSVADWERCILVASGGESSSENRAQATSLLDALRASEDGGANVAMELVHHNQSCASTQVLFFALTLLQAQLSKQQPDHHHSQQQQQQQLSTMDASLLQRAQQVLWNELVLGGDRMLSFPTYLRTKLGVTLALLIRQSFPSPWSTAFDDLTCLATGEERARQDLYLRILIGIHDEIVDSVNDHNTQIKDILRGIDSASTLPGATDSTSTGMNNNSHHGVIQQHPPETTIVARLVASVVQLFLKCRATASVQNPIANNNIAASNHEAQLLQVQALATLKRFVSWVDLSLIVQQGVLPILFSSLSHAGKGGDDDDETDDPGTQMAVEAIECLTELLNRGMDRDKKVALLEQLNVVQRIHESGIDLETVDVTHISVVIKIAELLAGIGLELLEFWDDVQQETSDSMDGSDVDDETDHDMIATISKLLCELMVLFFNCLAYNDIDVSAAVVPLASRLTATLAKETETVKTSSSKRNMNSGLVPSFSAEQYIPRLLSTMYKQMHYPNDFEYDYEDDNDAEEEMFRSELRKLNTRLVRVVPDLCLQFLCTALSNVPSPLSASPTSELEAALRLIFHYSEGLRRQRGAKFTPLHKNITFCQILTALHSSNVSHHDHREILILYYDISVRYHFILKANLDLLPLVLEAMSGVRGIQHPHPRVRSRSCYLLLKLIKALGETMKPYVETAVNGIQGLLSNPTAFPLQQDDSLYLFETIGLLVGKTGMEVSDQTHILTLVIAPHVQYIEKVLGSPDLQRDPDHFGSILSSSIAAIAFLSKGFEKRPAIEVQLILSETLHVGYTVLSALARNAPVRNKSMIFLQRMILCLNQKVLPPMPGFLDLLISNCTADDILDVSQLLLQLCIKFKEDAAPAIDAAVLPFLRQCHTLMPSLQEVVGHKEGDPIPPHLMIEQLSIKKMSYSFLQHVVTYRATAVLISPTNSSRIVDVLQSMNQGATEVHDPVVKKACVIFFRDLMDQWCDNSSNPNEDAIRKGCIQFVWETFLPGMLSCFLNSSFNERDAIQSRVIVEVANVLHVLKSKRGGDEFEQCFIISRLGAIQAPRNVVDGFRSATNEKDIEECLKGLLTEMKRT